MNWNFDSCPTSAEPISAEELVAEQSYDSLYHTLPIDAERNHLSGLLIGEDSLLGRKGILVVVPKRLRNMVVAMSHNPAVSRHLGRKMMYLTMRQDYCWPSIVIDMHNTVRRLPRKIE